ncbi:hypothetical protein APY04_2313 [Hyphomicrobium sulfonivorans]|uniref:Uncharacterized protein n=1 Tax=Hyphomicrobium sulfonivorans TaxID=121290 RepID=A0A109BDR9_HYPSL|nr:DUF6714 family protein [Hyphomicrobium sulfonivorans]KWT66906.1 hypothetical protein APY04_2313 [Hyphomicrobium sulfonivorans]
MTLSAAAIIEELKTAFPAKRSKRFVPMVNSVYGDEPFLIKAEFTDKDDWTKLTPEWLDVVPKGLASALSFLSNEAIRFYIPAFLAADLNGALDRVDPTFTLFHGFDNSSRHRRISPTKDETWTDFARHRWDHLTQAQAIAIVHYLEWRIEQDGLFMHRETTEALATYWYPRAAGIEPNLTKPQES